MTDVQINDIKAELKEIRNRVERLTYALIVLSFLSGAIAFQNLRNALGAG